MKLRKLLATAVPLTLLLALVAAGCGGGGDDTTAETQESTVEAKAALSKAALISQGDAICGEVNAAVGAIGAQEGGDVAEQTTQVADLYTNMVQNILDLGRPEDPTGYADFMAAAEELAKIEGEVALAAERDDTAALGEAATASAPALEEFQAQAAIYGFSECSEGPSAPSVPGTGTGSGEAEEGGVEVSPELEEEVIPEEVAPEEEIVPETGGAGGGVGEEVVPEGGGESGSGGGIGPG
jgi:hypothetical protein